MKRPLVVLLGRPNAGKSTLFNQITKKQLNIVNTQVGTTRDRLYSNASVVGYNFDIVDTVGLNKKMPGQSSIGIAINYANLLIMVIDIQIGITPSDLTLITMLQCFNKPLTLIINKIDKVSYKYIKQNKYRFNETGIKSIFFISAFRGLNVNKLFYNLLKSVIFLKNDHIRVNNKILEITLIGKPNSGKSSFVNYCFNDRRCVVSNVPGTTTDTTNVEIGYRNQNFILSDASGIRCRHSVSSVLEKHTISKSLIAIICAKVVLILVGGSSVNRQDKRLIAFTNDKGRGIIIVINKWDLPIVNNPGVQKCIKNVFFQIPFIGYAPICFISAVTGSCVFDILDCAGCVKIQLFKRILTSDFNYFLNHSLLQYNISKKKKREIKIYFGTQIAIAPPTFLIWCGDLKNLHFSYKRYLINKIREVFLFEGVPIRVFYRNLPDKFRKQKYKIKRVTQPHIISSYFI